MGGSTGDGSKEWGNWNPAGYDAPPKSLASVTDGLSNSILYGEVYANCYDRGRIAPGARADLVALDPQSLAVQAVWLAGMPV